jgi:group I intron endonuclease
MLNSGIYLIKNNINNKVYVGSSVNIKNRWSVHRSLLTNNKHDSIKLQNSWNKYGSENFTFEILEFCDENIRQVEEQWISYFDSFYKGYNMVEYTVTPSLGKSPNQETRSKQAKAKEKPFSLLNPDGKLITGYNLEKFAKDNNLHASSLHKVHKGKARYYKGWTSPVYYRKKLKTGGKGPKNSNNKYFEFISPEGNIVKAECLNELCRQYKLLANNMTNVYYGKQSHHKGWKQVNKNIINI